MALLAVALAVLGGVLAVLNRHTPTPNGDSATGSHTWGQFLLTLAFAAAGWLLASRCPDVIFGWLALAAAIGHGLAVAGLGWLVFTVGGGHHLPGATAAAVAALWGSRWRTP